MKAYIVVIKGLQRYGEMCIFSYPVQNFLNLWIDSQKSSPISKKKKNK